MCGVVVWRAPWPAAGEARLMSQSPDSRIPPAFGPVANVPGTVGATVSLDCGEIGVLFDTHTGVAALFMSDRISRARTHSPLDLASARAVIGLMSDLIDQMQAAHPVR